QTWNNCGPATLTMALSYYGWTQDQSVAASYLKPDSEDKNVSPGQMVRFVNENTGVHALVRMGGDLDMVRRLVAGGFPVLVETGYMPEGYDWMGHYRLVVAYDDSLQQIYVYDSFLGHGNFQGLPVSYDLFNSRWQDFNRLYIVLYNDASEMDLRAILGDQIDLAVNAQHALDVARQEATADPSNPFAWFNMGTSYLALGMYDEAAQAYDQARNAGNGLPWRMLWYQFGPFEAYFNVGRYDDVLALVQANLGTTPYVEETYYWTGMVYMARGQYGPARTQLTLALQHNRNFLPAQEALVQLDVAEAGG
ncbi:MAG: tetratricopeptide repeat protein, partial [Anaerolineae bacterium]|nr:tetratricopeptide repeat protein [Anaerolineae bacterium]